MNYSHLIKPMRWSYSRLTTFEQCPYKFFLQYISHERKRPLFFSDFGSFVHHILELYLTGLLPKEELPSFYLTRFQRKVHGGAPNPQIYRSFFNAGLDYLRNIDFYDTQPEAVEWKTEFKLGEYPFVGIIDVVSNKDGTLAIIDHKSHPLKPRTGKKNPTKSDKELDDYLRQLYLYSIPVYEKYGKFPDKLMFNCFRTGVLIEETFSEEKFSEVCRWALDLIARIIDCEDWEAFPEFFKCKYLCDCHDECDFFEISGR